MALKNRHIVIGHKIKPQHGHEQQPALIFPMIAVHEVCHRQEDYAIISQIEAFHQQHTDTDFRSKYQLPLSRFQTTVPIEFPQE